MRNSKKQWNNEKSASAAVAVFHCFSLEKTDVWCFTLSNTRAFDYYTGRNPQKSAPYSIYSRKRLHNRHLRSSVCIIEHAHLRLLHMQNFVKVGSLRNVLRRKNDRTDVCRFSHCQRIRKLTCENFDMCNDRRRACLTMKNIKRQSFLMRNSEKQSNNEKSASAAVAVSHCFSLEKTDVWCFPLSNTRASDYCIRQNSQTSAFCAMYHEQEL